MSSMLKPHVINVLNALYKVLYNAFKEYMQYLNLGKAQNTDFNGHIADTALALTTYTILSLGKHFESYETIGSLFHAN